MTFSVRAFVRDIVTNHPGEAQTKITELRDQLAAQDNFKPGTSEKDPEGFQNHLDLEYIEGYLETGGPAYLDCVNSDQKRAEKETWAWISVTFAGKKQFS